MVAPAVEGIDLLKIAGRSRSRVDEEPEARARLPMSGSRSDSRFEERLLLWLEYNPKPGQALVGGSEWWLRASNNNDSVYQILSETGSAVRAPVLRTRQLSHQPDARVQCHLCWIKLGCIGCDSASPYVMLLLDEMKRIFDLLDRQPTRRCQLV
jgi:hypothetical protein